MNENEAVWEQVEAFRERYLPGEMVLPVDVFALVEIDLRLDVIPFDDLFAKYSVDAAITQDFTGLYVDAEAYVLWEKGPVWKQKRLRFSVAHELGHYVMHRGVAEGRPFKTRDDFERWMRSHDGQKHPLEQSANEFAGRLLVPLPRLKEYFNQLAHTLDTQMPGWQKNPGMRSTFEEQIAPRFGVNSPVIGVRLDREGLWMAG